MAQLPRFKGFLLEDFKEAPEWLSKLLQPLNEFMTTVSNALSGRLTRKDNLLGYYEDFDFTTQATAANTFPLRFKNKLLGGVPPKAVSVGKLKKHNGAVLSAAWSIEWDPNQAGEIEIKFHGLENSTRYVGNLVVDG